MTVSQIISAITANEDTISELGERYRDGLIDIHKGLSEWIEANRDKKSKLVAAKVSFGQVQDLMIRAGLGSYLSPVEGMIEEAVDAAKAWLPGGGPSDILAMSDAAIKQSLQGVTLELGLLSERTTKEVQGLVNEMVTIPISKRDAVKRLQASTDILKRHASTVVETGLSQAQRELHLEAAEAIPTEERLRWYEGPNDGATRKFCKAIEGKALTDKQIGKLNNHQPMSVLTGGGGYNCRHQWVAVSRHFAERNDIELATSDDISKANAGAAK